MNQSFRLFGSIAKTEEQDDGTIKVFGVASSGARDHAGEIVKPDAMKAALPDYSKFPALREMHEPKAAGRVLEANVDKDGFTNIVAHVVDPVAVQKVKAQVYPAFSIGGKVLERDAADKSVISALRLVEISLVDSPCNPDAALTMWKADSMADEFKPAHTDVVARAKTLAKAAGSQRFKEFLFEAAQELVCEHELAKGEIEGAAEEVVEIDGTTAPVAEEVKEAAAETDPPAGETAAETDPPVGETETKEAAAEATEVVDPPAPDVDPNAAETTAEGDDKAAADTPDPANALATALTDALEKASKDDEPYGDVEYADPGYQSDGKKRYPLDSEEHIEHIRAAWNYIHQQKNADKYTAEQVSEIKGKIEAAWKAKIDSAGPPSAEKMAPYADLAKTSAALKAIGFDVSKACGEGSDALANKAFAEAIGLTKSLYTVGWLAQLLDQVVCIQSCSQCEEQYEGDDSAVPSQLMEICRQMGQTLINMAQEEVAEAIQAIGSNDVAIEIVDCDDDGIIVLANQIVDLTKADEELMAKAGARNSKADQQYLQDAHDSLAKAGAMCDPANCPDDDADKVAKLTSENERLAKALTDAIPQVEELSSVLEATKQEVADLRRRFDEEPLAPKTVGPGVGRVNKADDSTGNTGEAVASEEDVIEALAKLSDEERGLLMIKAAHRQPQLIAGRRAA